MCQTTHQVLDTLHNQLKHSGAESQQIAEACRWCIDLQSKLDHAAEVVSHLLTSLDTLNRRMDDMVQGMEFGFLYDTPRHIFHIGYNVDAEQPDPNDYDLLASEARVASLVAIAKGDVPQRHWLHMNRPLTRVDRQRALLSWSGTMFEYLMPLLWTRSYRDTLLQESTHAAVRYQITYGHQNNIPWGISESGYYQFDSNMNYQYQAFGVPGLGFKRGLEEDLVISPYASLLALSIEPRAVIENLHHLCEIGMLGQYGLYEAIDYTHSRLAADQENAIVRSYMVHHQGMIFLSLTNTLLNEVMVRRFHADPRIQSVELLLQERIPHAAPLEKIRSEELQPIRIEEKAGAIAPWQVPVDTPFPHVHYLANGQYGLLITNAGSGFSRYRGIDLTRWRADTTCDDWGTWLYIQNLDNGELRSVGPQPVIEDSAARSVTFAPHKVDFHTAWPDLTAHLEIVVSPDDALEIRRLHLINHSDSPQHLRLVSYAEIVLGQQDADRRHPAFNKLFIESEFLPKHNMLLFRRRPRSSLERSPVVGHLIVMETEPERNPTYETDRARFIGRQGTLHQPAALVRDGFAGTTGTPLNPILSLAQEIELAHHASADLAFITLAADNSSQAVSLAQKYRDWKQIDRTFNEADFQSQAEMHQLDLDSDTLQNNLLLLSLLLYPHATLRADSATLAENTGGQSMLWRFGISGDYPILVTRLHDETELGLVRELLLAHTYWRGQGLLIDLVIVNEKEHGYSDTLQGLLRRLVKRMGSEDWLNRHGGIFLLYGDTDAMSEAERTLLLTAARVVMKGADGALEKQLRDIQGQSPRLPAFEPANYGSEELPTPPVDRPADLLFDNGYGGFSADGREYILYLRPDTTTPAPWVNVIANPKTGFLISESGSGYTWAINSGENRLTSWNNDPVMDESGETLYLRDEETAAIWPPTPQPAGEDSPYIVRHGAGYTVFHHASHGLKQELRLFVVPDAPVKVIQLQMENLWNRPRRITTTYYAEWVMGVNRDTMQQYVIPEYVETCQALFARNPYNTEFGDRVAFLAGSEPPHGLTADRTEFLGPLGNIRQPAALKRVGLTGAVRPSLDPCAALQLHIDLQPGETKQIHFLLGQGENRAEAVELVQRFRDVQQVAVAWTEAVKRWDRLLSVVAVDTPDKAMNILMNRWLLYQSLSCRIWGRSAFYQSSGAYGFRDQLQDVMAFVHAAPQEARQHIIRAAGRQFDTGDVLHWWHPPSDRGVRTRITDDLLWLPYVATYYVRVTGDTPLLNELVAFRQGDPLAPDENEHYGHYETTDQDFTIYEHCCRALERGTTSGRHNLPLIGSGDWNDGLDRVGIEGYGESVWLGWFLYATLEAFLPVCETMNDVRRLEYFRETMSDLRQALEEHAWDGNWYLRAFYDDGTPLGSAQETECQIDAIVQSWAVISNAGNPERIKQAMASLDQRLVQEEDRLSLLFAPPFDKTVHDPGYIKGYPPGIRENGGQYTHAAIWSAWAFAQMGDGERAEALFRLLNPVYHSDTPEKALRYKVEPYVIAADIYSVEPFLGRGGWTWYTGSASWFYRLGLEAILGFHRQGNTLTISPRIPPTWDGYRIRYRYGETTYHIQVDNPDGAYKNVAQVTLDGQAITGGTIPLRDDGKQHSIVVCLGPAQDIG